MERLKGRYQSYIATQERYNSPNVSHATKSYVKREDSGDLDRAKAEYLAYISDQYDKWLQDQLQAVEVSRF